MSFIAKQPNGLYCIFSSVADCPTKWNLTAEDYIEYCAQRAKEEAARVLHDHVRPFEEVTDSFIPINMTGEEFKRFLEETKEPNTGDRKE